MNDVYDVIEKLKLKVSTTVDAVGYVGCYVVTLVAMWLCWLLCSCYAAMLVAMQLCWLLCGYIGCYVVMLVTMQLHWLL